MFWYLGLAISLNLVINILVPVRINAKDFDYDRIFAFRN